MPLLTMDLPKRSKKSNGVLLLQTHDKRAERLGQRLLDQWFVGHPEAYNGRGLV